MQHNELFNALKKYCFHSLTFGITSIHTSKLLLFKRFSRSTIKRTPIKFNNWIVFIGKKKLFQISFNDLDIVNVIWM